MTGMPKAQRHITYVPEDSMINVSQMTIDGLLRRAAEVYGAKTSIIDGATELTFAELDALVDAFACALSELGVVKGDRVAALFYNQWQFQLTYFATMRLGALIVPVNNRLVADEIAYQLDDAAVKAVVYAAEFDELVSEVAAATSVQHWIGAATAPEAVVSTMALEPLVERHRGRRPVVRESVEHLDPSGIWYTSGTTGQPKGAVVSHASTIWAATSLALATRMTHDSRVLAVAPMFHRGPMETSHVASFLLGCTQAMLTTFGPDKLLRAIEEHRATHAFIVPAMTFAVLNLPGCGDYDLTSVRCWLTASAHFPEEYRARLESMTTLPPDTVFNAYGITESLLVGVLSPEEAAHHPGSVGLPVYGARVRILDGERRTVPAGTVGEITVATPAIASTYAGQQEAWDAATFVDDGAEWYLSGDLGYLDSDGFLYIVDRSKDMVISGGENVYSAEVEKALVSLEGVAEVAVIGLPDERWGEAVTAVVVRKPSIELDATAVIEYCAGRLAGYKRPRRVVFVDALPRNSFGKVRKDVLRGQHSELDGGSRREDR